MSIGRVIINYDVIVEIFRCVYCHLPSLKPKFPPPPLVVHLFVPPDDLTRSQHSGTVVTLHLHRLFPWKLKDVIRNLIRRTELYRTIVMMDNE